MLDEDAARLELALNRLDPSIIHAAIGAIQHRARRSPYHIKRFVTGAANPGERGVTITRDGDGNFAFKLVFRSQSAFDLQGEHSVLPFTFSEMTMTPDNMLSFATILREVLEHQGWRT